jgi:hypothetical protein
VIAFLLRASPPARCLHPSVGMMRCRRTAPARKELHNTSNKSELEATSGRSTHYGRGYPAPAFRGIGRTFS